MATSQSSRRSWLKQVAGGIGAGLGVVSVEASARRQDAERPRNIIFMVSDGMSLGVPTLVEPFSRIVRDTGTQWWSLAARPDVSRGWFDMRSLDSLVTDSAAASSSWGSGSRVFNSAVNVLPDGTRLTPIADVARAAGRRVGLVTTTTVTHATPAGFAASVPDRDDEAGIAAQYLGRVDVALGGGRPHFDPAKRQDRRDVVAAFAAQGYATWTNRAQLAARGSHDRALGLFWDGHLPYTIDRQHDPALTRDVPTLVEMTQAALDMLARAPNGFLLQVEGGRVDHAAHANDAAAILWEQLAFDDAVATVLAFAESRADTLVVVTSDHGNSNPGLIGLGDDYDESDAAFARLVSARSSYSAFRAALQAPRGPSGRVKPDAVRAGIEQRLGIEVTARQAKDVSDVMLKYAKGRRVRSSVVDRTIGQVLGAHTGIGWTGTTHTADLVPVLALGPGRQRFEGLRANVDAFTVLSDLMGQSFRNPAMTPEQARRLHKVALDRTPAPHWV